MQIGVEFGEEVDEDGVQEDDYVEVGSGQRGGCLFAVRQMLQGLREQRGGLQQLGSEGEVGRQGGLGGRQQLPEERTHAIVLHLMIYILNVI